MLNAICKGTECISWLRGGRNPFIFHGDGKWKLSNAFIVEIPKNSFFIYIYKHPVPSAGFKKKYYQ